MYLESNMLQNSGAVDEYGIPLEAGFSFGFGDDGIKFGIDLMSDQYEEFLEEGHYNPYDPNLETGFSFGVNDSGFNIGVDLFSS